MRRKVRRKGSRNGGKGTHRTGPHAEDHDDWLFGDELAELHFISVHVL